MEWALYYLWFVLALVFNNEKQTIYNCEANDVGDVDAYVMNKRIVYACDEQTNCLCVLSAC